MASQLYASGVRKFQPRVVSTLGQAEQPQFTPKVLAKRQMHGHSKINVRFYSVPALTSC